MRQKLKTGMLFTLYATLGLGIIYPLLMSGLGSLLPAATRPVMMVQAARDNSWFQGRPFEAPAVPAAPTAKEGRADRVVYHYASNLSLTNPVLWQEAAERAKRYHDQGNDNFVAFELLFASASGYDPYISVPAALQQIPRIARLRNLDMPLLKRLVDQNTQKKLFGFIGVDMVNVIELNRLLNRIAVNDLVAGAHSFDVNKR